MVKGKKKFNLTGKGVYIYNKILKVCTKAFLGSSQYEDYFDPKIFEKK